MTDYTSLKPQDGTADYITKIPAFYDAVELDVTALELRSTNIETKTDFITVTQAVNLTTEQDKLATIEAGATADQTGAEIKIAYESEADTNAYNDVAVNKLATIEAGATADQTGAEIKIAYESEADTNAFTDADVISLATNTSNISTNISNIDNNTTAITALQDRVVTGTLNIASILKTGTSTAKIAHGLGNVAVDFGGSYASDSGLVEDVRLFTRWGGNVYKMIIDQNVHVAYSIPSLVDGEIGVIMYNSNGSFDDTGGVLHWWVRLR